METFDPEDFKDKTASKVSVVFCKQTRRIKQGRNPGFEGLPVQHTACHVLSMSRIAFHHLIGWLKARVRDLSHSQLFVVGLLGRDDGGVRSQGEMNPRVWHEVGLKLCQIHVQSAVESQGRRDRRHDLPDQAVEIRVSGSLDVQIPPANVVDGLVVHHKGAV